MPLIDCHECGHQVSTTAKNCPKCGAKVVLPKKPLSTTTKAIGLLAAVTMVGVVISTNQQKEERAREAASQSSEQKAAQAKRNAQLQWAAAGAASLKKTMKDPSSFELTSLYVTMSGFGCYEYRGKNSFGAILPSSAVLTPKGQMLSQDHNGNEFTKAWNKECTTKGGQEIAPLVKQLRII